MKVGIVKYNAGNTVSVINALKRQGIDPVVTDDAETLRSADKVIFPGVGEASTAMRYLRMRGLDIVIPSLTQPVLGICLGMQLMCAFSEENETACLGILPHRVRRFVSDRLKIPHTGWNRIGQLRSPLFDGVGEGERVYFVHGYYVETGADTTAVTDYGLDFSAGVGRGNFHAIQFHPEKSGDAGARILANFLKI
ncbi:MAG: imidazole glycerol phosphate synthase subunit HisH [Pyrinomonadaceae bacterium]|nr:imidazole glycerol phosphate synthase subunit HisH [Pyrinomonadaceae bacterium]MBP6213762.1 imidazole glycerol phosphate synthase subunit HisH [Pyrinomonadaceae bacterium]